MENLSNMASPDDEAGVRLVGNDEKNGKSSKEKPVEVLYMPPDSQNGDAKIDIENLKTAFAGMGKEELMKYANDPFWVKMRWFLFVLFWLIWIAMLAGAIAIIILAPKCSAPSPREWWEQSPMYQVDVRSFKDGSDPQDGVGDLKGLESKLDYVKDLGVQTVVLSSILKSAPDSDSKVAAGDLDGVGGHVIDYKDIDPSIGTIQQFKQLANAMKEKGLHMLMSFVPNHSSDKHPWFVKSINGTEPYTDYYIWAPPKKYDPIDGRTPIPPNNWISVKGGSAWEWNPERKMFYLHQFDKSQPDFNFRNQNVVDYFIEVLKFWLENGVSGFHLDKVQYLLEDEGFRDEPTSEAIGAIHDQYDYLKHIYTTDLETLSVVLQQWNKIPANNSGILSVTGMRPSPNLQATDRGTSTTAATVVEDKKDNEESSVGQLFVRPQFFQGELTAESLRSAINSTLKASTKPTWDFVCKLGTDCITEDMLPGIQVVSLMLPGTPITKSGSELGLIKTGIMPWDNSTNGGFTAADKPWTSINSDYQDCNVAEQLSNPNSQLNLFKKLVKTRASPAIMHGVTNTGVLSNTVFTFTRIKSGNPGYLVAFNINKNATTVDLTQLEGVPDDLTVFARTPTIDVPVNSTALSTARSSKLNGKEVTIEPYAAIVLQFVPKSSG